MRTKVTGTRRAIHKQRRKTEKKKLSKRFMHMERKEGYSGWQGRERSDSPVEEGTLESELIF